MLEDLDVAFYVFHVVYLLVAQRAQSCIAELAHELQIDAEPVLDYAVLYSLKAVPRVFQFVERERVNY